MVMPAVFIAFCIVLFEVQHSRFRASECLQLLFFVDNFSILLNGLMIGLRPVFEQSSIND